MYFITSLEYFDDVDDANVLWPGLSPLCSINNVVGISVGVFSCIFVPSIVVPPRIRVVDSTYDPDPWWNNDTRLVGITLTPTR